MKFVNSSLKFGKDGIWYHEGTEITHVGICSALNNSLTKDDNGRYRVSIGEEWSYVDIEDTPFVVRELSFFKDPPRFMIFLNDSTKEELNLGSLWIGGENVIYCMVKDGAYETRFLRPAYYELAKYIEHDKNRDVFFISLNGEKYYIRKKE